MKKSLVALAAVLGFVLLSAEGCDSTQKGRVGLVNDVARPPLAQTLGCPEGKWRVSVDPDGHEGESVEQRAKARKAYCLDEKSALKYTPGSVYP